MKGTYTFWGEAGRITVQDKNGGRETWKIYLRSRKKMRRKWKSKMGVSKKGKYDLVKILRGILNDGGTEKRKL